MELKTNNLPSPLERDLSKEEPASFGRRTVGMPIKMTNTGDYNIILSPVATSKYYSSLISL